MQNELLILIVDPDVQFREELFNFLLSAGYKHVDTADDFAQALVKIQQAAPDVILLDVTEGVRNERIKAVAEINPDIRVISMIRAEDQEQWSQQSDSPMDFELIIKDTFSRNIFYMLRKAYSERTRCSS